MLRDLGLVNGLDDRTQDPNRLYHVGRSRSRFNELAHLASSRSALRNLPMPSRAIRICASKAES